MIFSICDDESSQVELLSEYICEWSRDRNISCEIRKFFSAEAFIFDWEENRTTDILLLDIQMKEMNGMEVAVKLREKKDNTQIIFVTGVIDYVYDGYFVDAVSYIIKPVKKHKLFESLDKAVNRLTREEPVLIVEEVGAVTKVKVKDICYIESVGHNSYIHTVDAEIRSKKGINDMENELVPIDYGFIRPHRSYIVNISKINSITKKDVITEDGSKLPIARGKWEDINRAYLDYYRGKQ